MERKRRFARSALPGFAALMLALSVTLAAKLTLYPVTADFRCDSKSNCGSGALDDSGALVLDRLQGDGLPYAGSTDGAYLDAGYDFYFMVPVTSGRRVYLDFSAPIGSPACGASCTMNFTEVWAGPSPAVMSPASITNPVDANGVALKNGLYDVTTTAQAFFKFDFMDPGGRPIRYTMRLNPTAYPASSYATVTRAGTKQWTIEAAAGAVAALESQSTKSGKAPKILEGYFSMPFKITVTQ